MPWLLMKPAMDELLTIAPPRPCFSICRISYFRQSHVPLRLMSMVSVPFVLGLLHDRDPMALDARVVKGIVEAPKSLDSFFDQGFDFGCPRHVRPDEDSFAPGAPDQVTVAFPSISRRPATTTRAPFLANRTDVSRPMPEVPPVTSATLPSHSAISFSSPVQISSAGTRSTSQWEA